MVAVMIAPMAAGAQEHAPPNVNECTFLKEPTALRDCIDRFEGELRPQIDESRVPEGPLSPVPDQPLTSAAGAIPGRPGASYGSPAHPIAERPTRIPPPVYIDQIPPRR
ncbi:hypothetical protein ABEG18_06025 [Alsobacter sp. KACC 23698]|uniref:Uncharacterized protein n=1 Tax=Alsobacter sp. KACC 23698 TaxID=3149229 RepID=A0AAU7JJD2_9HYPH